MNINYLIAMVIGLTAGYISKSFYAFNNDVVKLAVIVFCISILYIVLNRVDVWLKLVTKCVAVFCISFVAGNIYYGFVLNSYPKIEGAMNVKGKLTVNKVEYKEKYNLVYADIIDENANAVKINNVIFYSFSQESPQINSEYIVSGKLYTSKILLPDVNHAAQNVTQDNLKSFDLMSYYRTKGAQAILEINEIKKLDKTETIKREGVIDRLIMYKSKISNYIKNNIKQNLNPTEGSVIVAMTFGDDSGLSDKIKDSFLTSGLSHVLVLSGYNIALLVGISFYILKRQSKNTKAILSMLLVIIYSTIIVVEAPIVRAIIMGSLALLAYASIKKHNMKYIVWMSILLFAIVTPYSYLNSLSMQLSLIATLSIVYFTPIISEYIIDKIPNFLNEILAVILGVSVLTIPYVAFTFGTINISGLFANVIAAPIVGLISIIGFMWIPVSILMYVITYLELGAISETLLNVIQVFEKLFSYITDIITKVLMSISETFSVHNFIIKINLTFTGLILYYIIISSFYVLYRLKKI